MSVIDSVLKANPWIYKTNYLIGEKIIGNFYEKESLLYKLQKKYYPEADVHIREKSK